MNLPKYIGTEKEKRPIVWLKQEFYEPLYELHFDKNVIAYEKLLHNNASRRMRIKNNITSFVSSGPFLFDVFKKKIFFY